MVSAEVQRTLVKSPPELWGELSDPASLARHLGELGEIRITRAEPEKALEWETEEASGTVAIKPSGWGTRVTLTLQRHDREPSAPARAEAAETQSDAEAAGASHAGAAQVAAGEPGPGAVADEMQQFVAQPRSELSQAAEAHPPTAEAHPPTAEAGSQAAEARPQAAEAHSPAAEAGSQAAETRTQAAEARPQEEAAAPGPGDSPGIARAPEDPAPQELTGEDAPGPSAGAPRRSFWSRLFRRRGSSARTGDRKTASARSDDPEAGAGDVPARHGWIQLPRPATAAAQAACQDIEEEGTVSEDAAQREPADAGPSSRLIAAEPAPQPIAQRGEGDPPPAAAEAEPEAEDPAARAAAAEATALLSAVLDRLGAAHHRPFSRP